MRTCIHSCSGITLQGVVAVVVLIAGCTSLLDQSHRTVKMLEETAVPSFDFRGSTLYDALGALRSSAEMFAPHEFSGAERRIVFSAPSFDLNRNVPITEQERLRLCHGFGFMRLSEVVRDLGNRIGAAYRVKGREVEFVPLPDGIEAGARLQ